ncbi:MAG: hypothetical protein Q8M98_06325 [Candidatus Cloacimonadaceae bacterium]|nr:hypothetical protein [Candidatus Cloacimonadaceae bacterium]MDP3114378.1 hypothetical protein [Candidatus Cloacimonadaceae bacterium]
MKKQEQQKVQISGIVDTITDPESGKGMLGFVITFPEGKIQNQALDYNQSNYREIALRIADLHQKAKIRYQKSKQNFTSNTQQINQGATK